MMADPGERTALQKILYPDEAELPENFSVCADWPKHVKTAKAYLPCVACPLLNAHNTT
jgi:hypothetical protein